MVRKLPFTLAVWLLASATLIAADPKAKILLIGKDLDHARNTHTYMSDCELLAKCLRQTEGVEAVVSNGWPWLQAMGGWFNAEGDGFSRYLVQTSRLRQADPGHPICRGWGDFELRE